MIEELDSLQEEFDLGNVPQRSEVACADSDQQDGNEQEERDDFQVFDNPLFELSAEETYDNPLFMMDNETCGEVTKHEIEYGFQINNDLTLDHEDVTQIVISNLPRLLDNEHISGFEDQVSTWVVLNQDIFSVLDIKMLTKQVLVAAGNFMTAARSEESGLVTQEEGEKEEPKQIVYFLDNPSLGWSDVLAHTSPFLELALKTTLLPCSTDVNAFVVRLQGFTRGDTNPLRVHLVLMDTWRCVVYFFRCVGNHSWLGILVWHPRHGMAKLIGYGWRDSWRDKDQFFRISGVANFLTSHLVVPFVHQQMDWKKILSVDWRD